MIGFGFGTNQLTLQWFGGPVCKLGLLWNVPGWNRVKARHLFGLGNEFNLVHNAFRYIF